MNERPDSAESNGAHDDPAQPRTSGDVVQQPSVQIGLILLLVFLALLVLGVVWSLIN